MTDPATILIIDDEIPIRRLLEITLFASGFRIFTAATGKEGLLMAATEAPSLILLDLGLPDIEGTELLTRFREWYSGPILILSVRNSESDIVRALDLGANDYLTKPFRTGELLARIRAAIRSQSVISETPILETGGLTIDFSSHTVRRGDHAIRLTATEYSLLTLLARNEGRVLTHQVILKEVWGMGYVEQTQYLRVFIAQLRKKIEVNPAQPVLINTESGIGYRFGE